MAQKHNLFNQKTGQKKVSDQQRWQILGLLKDRTKTEREIAELVGVSQKCVNATKRNFQATYRVNNIGNCGRRSKLSNRDVSYIFRLVRKNPSTSYRQIPVDFNSKLKEHKISRETVRRVLAKKERRNWTNKDWAKVIFCDESNFEVNTTTLVIDLIEQSKMLIDDAVGTIVRIARRGLAEFCGLDIYDDDDSSSYDYVRSTMKMAQILEMQ
ncbi:hypothetical protein BpHYR1_007722 [Brachionus plicatilis]|uniref:Transposase Tc1-like domain-containing protein n=1 Tax=Brachionus plicatilis TaxID=10195 RepID=A0A3M7RXV4_BRAPC|nr:hypothetical protein BpHYR1_007722 [Brachionus plicatilis]